MPGTLPKGTQVGNYELLELIQPGGYAEVYKGKHIGIGRVGAVKVLHTALLPFDHKADHNKKTEPDSTAQFNKEMEIVGSFDHPNIIPMWECGIMPSGRAYIVMPLMKEDLDKRIRGQVLTLEKVLTYVLPIAEALNYAHERLFVHRDLKPNNILLSENNWLYVADFGSAAITTSIGTSVAEIQGTFPYMAPEQFRGKHRRKSDQYALGVMVYKMLCGKLPIFARVAGTQAAPTYKDLHENQTVPSFASQGVSVVPEIEKIILRALEKDPDNRFPTILDFSHALEEVRNKAIRQAQAERERKRLQAEAEEKQRLLDRIEVLEKALVEKQQLLNERDALKVRVEELEKGSDKEELRKARGDIHALTTERDDLKKRFQALELQSLRQKQLEEDLSKVRGDIRALTSERDLLKLRVQALERGSKLPSEEKVPVYAAKVVEPVVQEKTEQVKTGDILFINYDTMCRILAWSPDGKFIATGTTNNTVELLDAKTGDILLTYGEREWGSIASLAWSPDGKSLASGGEEGLVRVYNMATKIVAVVSDKHGESKINSLAWSPDGKNIVTGSSDGLVSVFDVQRRKRRLTNQPYAVSPKEELRSVPSVDWSPDGKLLAYGGMYCGAIQVRNNYSFHYDSKYDETKPKSFVAWSPDGKFIAYSIGNMVMIHDSQTRRREFSYESHTWSIISGKIFKGGVNSVNIAWSPDGKFIASGGTSSIVDVVSVETQKSVFQYFGQDALVSFFAWSPNGKFIASCSDDNTVEVWAFSGE